eukprot:8094558-Pyramimonas_sp.AAC.1
MEWAAPPGKQVWVKVVDLRSGNDGRVRMGCSMKLVNQDDGTDLVSESPRRAMTESDHFSRRRALLYSSL